MSDFREMRRKLQQLSQEESIGILQNATADTLALRIVYEVVMIQQIEITL
jgi:hypothetical protein